MLDYEFGALRRAQSLLFCLAAKMGEEVLVATVDRLLMRQTRGQLAHERKLRGAL